MQPSLVMSSKLLGYMVLDVEAVASEIPHILNGHWTNAYEEYALGHWTSIMLWNRTGRAIDGFSQEYDGCARPTEVGRPLEYLNSRIEQTFAVRHIKSVRVFRAKSGGFIIPHVDYMEFKSGFHRLHVPLQTSPGCFNSERSFVYHMRRSEIWWLDGTLPHSGGCLSAGDRLHLVLDFDPSIDLSEIIVDPHARVPRSKPLMIERPDLTIEEAKALLNLYQVISPNNFADVVSMLAKVHFERRVAAEAMYQ